MKKTILLYSFVFSILFSGCSHFTFNAAMCDSISSDPNAVRPEECRNYDEEEADKAFNQTKHKSTTTDEDVIKFQQDDKDK